MDQPASEIVRLEKILGAYSRYEDYQNDKNNTRRLNRHRHEPTVVTTEEL